MIINEKHKKFLNESKDVIRTDKTGMSFYDDFLNKEDHKYKKLCKGLQGEIVMMSPDDYIKGCSKIFNVPVRNVLNGVINSNVNKYADEMKNGTKFNLPILNYAQNEQEGRHRALAAKKLGVDKIPVLVVTKYDYAKELGCPDYIKVLYGHSLYYGVIYDDDPEPYYSSHYVGGMDEEKLKSAIKKAKKLPNICKDPII